MNSCSGHRDLCLLSLYSYVVSFTARESSDLGGLLCLAGIWDGLQAVVNGDIHLFMQLWISSHRKVLRRCHIPPNYLPASQNFYLLSPISHFTQQNKLTFLYIMLFH